MVLELLKALPGGVVFAVAERVVQGGPGGGAQMGGARAWGSLGTEVDPRGWTPGFMRRVTAYVT